MITEFADTTTTDIYNGNDTRAARAIPKTIWGVVRRKLDMVNAAADVMDLRTPPGNRLEKLAGNLAGFYSVRVNDQFRIVFKFANGAASSVRVTDYH